MRVFRKRQVLVLLGVFLGVWNFAGASSVVVQALVKDLASPNDRTRQAARARLRVIPFDEMDGDLLRAAVHPDKTIRRGIIELYAQIGRKDASYGLQKIYWREEDPYLREMVLGYLEQSLPESSRAVAFWREVAFRDKDGESRRRSLVALARWVEGPYQKRIAEVCEKIYARDDFYPNRTFAGTLLCQMGDSDPRYLQSVAEGLASRYVETRRHAALQFYKLPAKVVPMAESDVIREEWFKLASRLSQDPDGQVRQNLAIALGKSRITFAIPVVIVFLKDDNPSVRVEAVRSLALYADKVSSKFFVEALEDGDLNVKEAALEAIAKVESVDFIPIIKQFLQEEKDIALVELAKKVLDSLSNRKLTTVPSLLK